MWHSLVPARVGVRLVVLEATTRADSVFGSGASNHLCGHTLPGAGDRLLVEVDGRFLVRLLVQHSFYREALVRQGLLTLLNFGEGILYIGVVVLIGD